VNKVDDPIENAIKNLGPTLRAANGPREFRPWAKVVLWAMFVFVLAIGALDIYIQVFVGG